MRLRRGWQNVRLFTSALCLSAQTTVPRWPNKARSYLSVPQSCRKDNAMPGEPGMRFWRASPGHAWTASKFEKGCCRLNIILVPVVFCIMYRSCQKVGLENSSRATRRVLSFFVPLRARASNQRGTSRRKVCQHNRHLHGSEPSLRTALRCIS